jgi:hypothetical protein
MSNPKTPSKVVAALAVGILVGGLAAAGLFMVKSARKRDAVEKLPPHVKAPSPAVKKGESKRREDERRGVPDEGASKTCCKWCYMKVDEDGWSAVPIEDESQLKKRIVSTGKDLAIPIYPTVYVPSEFDKPYNDTILQSDIKKGDKILVIGAGSGSDVWVAWLKSRSLVYAIEINPLGVANINTTAGLGRFPVKAIVGDIRNMEFPEDFRDFDYVLWNMPFLSITTSTLEDRNYHFGDDGTILKSFLALLPSLLKKGGKVILYNSAFALEYIRYPNLKTKGDGRILVYSFSLDGP